MVEPIVGNVHEGVGGAAEKYKNFFKLNESLFIIKELVLFND
jgi:hypothetical protein